MPKSKTPQLSKQQQKLVRALATSKTVAEAGRKAGINHRPNTHRALNRIREKMPEILDRIGLSDEYLAQSLKPLLKADETQFFAYRGKVTDSRTVPNYDVRMRAVDALAKLRSAYPKNGNGHGVGDPAGVTINLNLLTAPGIEEALVGAEIDV